MKKEYDTERRGNIHFKCIVKYVRIYIKKIVKVLTYFLQKLGLRTV